MDGNNSNKAARRKRKRLKKKEKLAENCEIKEDNQVKIEEVDKQEEMNKSQEKSEKSREQILAERQAKKSSKKKETPETVKKVDPTPSQPATKPVVKVETPQVPKVEAPKPSQETVKSDKTREQILAEREAKKQAKLAGKGKKPDIEPVKKEEIEKVVVKIENLEIKEEVDGKKVLSKAERRAIQEAQRAAKAKAAEDKKQKSKPEVVKKVAPPVVIKTHSPSRNVVKTSSTTTHKVKLFKHLYLEKPDLNILANSGLHPAIIQLGFQYATSAIVGSNARCYAFLKAMKSLIQDYETPAEKVFSRGLEAEIQPAVEFLQKCRPFAVSMTNALKYIKMIASQETSMDDNDDVKKQRLVDKIETYAQDQIETAAKSISLKVREKISDGDVILTFGCSSLIRRTLIEASKESELKFRVIVVDSRPDFEGQQMLESLTIQGINCTYVLINAVSFIMPEVTKVILGAHALLANGSVMSRVGTAQLCLIANAHNVPVLVCCETHKFSERVQTDSFVSNEIGDPNALAMNKNTGKSYEHLKDWESSPHLTPLNLKYDVTPPELITAVVTEVAILPCTSVQVILRVKPAE